MKRAAIITLAVGAVIAIGVGARYLSPKDDGDFTALAAQIQSTSFDYPTAIANLQRSVSIENAGRAVGESYRSIGYVMLNRLVLSDIVRTELAQQYMRDTDDCLDALDRLRGYPDFVAFHELNIAKDLRIADVLAGSDLDYGELEARIDEKTSYVQSDMYEQMRARAVSSSSDELGEGDYVFNWLEAVEDTFTAGAKLKKNPTFENAYEAENASSKCLLLTQLYMAEMHLARFITCYDYIRAVNRCLEGLELVEGSTKYINHWKKCNRYRMLIAQALGSPGADYQEKAMEIVEEMKWECMNPEFKKWIKRDYPHLIPKQFAD